MERDCESELSKLNIEQNACIYHFGASVIHGQRSNILRLRRIDLLLYIKNNAEQKRVWHYWKKYNKDWEKVILYIFNSYLFCLGIDCCYKKRNIADLPRHSRRINICMCDSNYYNRK